MGDDKSHKQKRGKVVVAVSRGFDPLHVGHARMFKETRTLGDELVIINNRRLA